MIPADQTQDTLELQQALDDIDRWSRRSGPAELASAMASGAGASTAAASSSARSWTR